MGSFRDLRTKFVWAWLILNLFMVESSYSANQGGNPNKTNQTNIKKDQKYIVVVEHGFQNPNSFDQVLQRFNACKGFTYTPEYSNLSWHGEQVKNVIETSGAGLGTIPIGWGAIKSDKSFFQIFDCIDELATEFNIVGINFSTGGQEWYKSDLKQKAALFDRVELQLAAKIKSFLEAHPAIITAFAVGNRRDRLEDVFVFPLTAACNHKQPSNLKCITAFRVIPSANLEKKEDQDLANVYDPTDNQSEKIEDQSLQIVGRFSEQGNYIALPAEEQVLTSFLSPLFLSKYLSKQMTIVGGKAIANDPMGEKVVVVPIQLVYEKIP